eukprot:TRINITY_DN1277_c0_g1_i3.p1 TRINITY_DN1277_c0_g1~~TRINITY_DN1277_c0_g1_i3.p1  ORF type:complete len:275 (+),score=3.96 TRINITY_DN1277_c0_g1_i3:48-827(+)
MVLVVSSHVDLETPSGKMRTHVYEPRPTGDALGMPVEYNPKKLGGIIFYTAIFQCTPGIERMATRLASAGFVVFVPEVWHTHLEPGTVLPADAMGTAKGNELKTLVDLKHWETDVQVLVAALRQHPRCNGRIGTIGHCLGGHLVVRAAFNPDILASASFFPTDIHNGTLGVNSQADTLERLPQIKGEITVIFGRQDPHIPDAGRLKIYSAFQQAKINYTWHEFNANHSFLMDNDPKGRYDPEVADLCFRLVFDLFHRNL